MLPGGVATPNFEENVLHGIEETPSTSTQTIARGMGMLHSTDWEVLHEHQMHPYHPQTVYVTGPADLTLRANLC